MGVTLSNSVEKGDWVHGSPNDNGIQISLTNTNPSGTTQRTTVTVSDNGSANDYTTAELQEMIKKITVYDSASGAYKAQSTRSNVCDQSGGSNDIVAVVEFDAPIGDAVAAYGVGYT